jgi:Flp pilus assembly pilin Flp
MVSAAHYPDHESMRGLKDLRREEGQTMAEYAIVLAVITPAIVGAIAVLSFVIADNIQSIADFFS